MKTRSASTKPAITTLRRFPKKAAMANLPFYESVASLAHPPAISALFLSGQSAWTPDVEPQDDNEASHHDSGEEGRDDAHTEGHREAAYRAGAQLEQNQRG